jgi:hypothetical protein
MIDQFVLDVLSDLVVSAFSSLAGRVWLYGGRTLNRRSLERQLQEEPDLADRFRRVSVELFGPQIHSDTQPLIALLKSSEIQAIVRQVYSEHLVVQADRQGSRQPMHMGLIRAEFRLAIRIAVDGTCDVSDESADSLFDIVTACCNRAVRLAIKDGLLDGHEAASAHRTRVVLEELASIKGLLEVLRSPDLDRAQCEAFERQYRRETHARNGYLRSPHLERGARIPLDRLYVEPDLFPRLPPVLDERRSLADVRSSLHRTVVVGNPGAGKTTFAMAICHALSKPHEDDESSVEVTPILVTLRDYAVDKASRHASLLQHIQLTASSRYQLDPPAKVFEYLLSQGKCLVIFDGLDELIDTTRRREVTEDIEAFCRLFPTVRLLVTSRRVGYDEAPLDPSQFDVLHIGEFSQSQVARYVHNWFASDPDLDSREQVALSESFLSDSDAVPDLRSNPLMLALMCGLYRAEGYIPANRPDVYEKCASLLFEKWDKRRGIGGDSLAMAQVAPALAFVAHWIYSEPELERGVSERELSIKTALYLRAKRGLDEDTAALDAAELVRFCMGRAWVFTDAGTLRSGERLYQFSHRTFLEYYTADYLLRTTETAKDLWLILKDRLSRGEWDVVAQMAFQRRHRSSETAGDALLESVINESARAGVTEAMNLAYFGARCLEFMLPGAVVVRDVAARCISVCIQIGLADTYPSVTIESIFSALLSCADSNETACLLGIRNALEHTMRSGDMKAADVAMKLTMSLEPSPTRRLSARLRANVERCWEFREALCRDHSPRLRELAVLSEEVARELFLREVLDISFFGTRFGYESLFRSASPSLRGVADTGVGGAITVVLLRALLGDVSTRGRFKMDDQRVCALCCQFASVSTFGRTWVHQSGVRENLADVFASARSGGCQWWETADSAARMGAFVICATLLELRGDSKALKEIHMSSLPPALLTLLLARVVRKADDELESDLDAIGGGRENKKRVREWCRRERSFTDVPWGDSLW